MWETKSRIIKLHFVADGSNLLPRALHMNHRGSQYQIYKYYEQITDKNNK